MNTKRLLISISAASFAVAMGGNAALAATSSGPVSVLLSATMSTAMSDAAITAKVKAMLTGDASLKNSDITVTTKNGVVTLTGSAPTSDAKSVAGDHAKMVEGVSSVDNDIKTPSVMSKIGEKTEGATGKVEDKTKHAAKSTKRVVSDSWITTKVKSSLLADSMTKGFKIHVKTRHHVVALRGTVDSQASVDRAAELAKQIDHVESVDTSALKISSN